LDDEDIPDSRQVCIDSCIDAHPGWDVTIWRDVADFGLLRNKRAFFGADELAPATWPHARYQIASNVLRFEVMARYGGVFFDTDMYCLRPIDDLIEQAESQGKAGALGWEIQDKWLGEAFIACEPGAPFMEKIVANLEGWAFKHKGRAATVTVGPQYITPLLKGSPEIDDVLVMPQTAFFPARHNQPALGDAMVRKASPDTWCVHGFFNYRRRVAT
jgi:mannosyltransferase OCH1-like enzyme